MREYGRTPFRTCLLLALTTVFAACGGGGDGSGSDASPPVGSPPPPQPAPTLPPPQSDPGTDDSVITATLSGSVGDGPVVGAALEFYDSDGADIASVLADADPASTLFVVASKTTKSLPAPCIFTNEIGAELLMSFLSRLGAVAPAPNPQRTGAIPASVRCGRGDRPDPRAARGVT